MKAMDGKERDRRKTCKKEDGCVDYEPLNFSKEFNYKTGELRGTRSSRLRRSRIAKCGESVSCTFE